MIIYCIYIYIFLKLRHFLINGIFVLLKVVPRAPAGDHICLISTYAYGCIVRQIKRFKFWMFYILINIIVIVSHPPSQTMLIIRKKNQNWHWRLGLSVARSNFSMEFFFDNLDSSRQWWLWHSSYFVLFFFCIIFMVWSKNLVLTPWGISVYVNKFVVDVYSCMEIFRSLSTELFFYCCIIYGKGSVLMKICM